VEQVGLTEPVNALKAASVQVVVIAPQGGLIQGMNHHQQADKLTVDHDLASVSADQFDALVLAGGVANPDLLLTNPRAMAFVRQFVQAGKPAAICHALWALIEADGVRGRRMTSWPSLRTDLKNAGATWGTNQRQPGDVPQARRSAGCREMVKLFSTGQSRKAA
jgi:protease I